MWDAVEQVAQLRAALERWIADLEELSGAVAFGVPQAQAEERRLVQLCRKQRRLMTVRPLLLCLLIAACYSGQQSMTCTVPTCVACDVY